MSLQEPNKIYFSPGSKGPRDNQLESPVLLRSSHTTPLRQPADSYSAYLSKYGPNVAAYYYRFMMKRYLCGSILSIVSGDVICTKIQIGDWERGQNLHIAN
jgi:hypothetical protein